MEKSGSDSPFAWPEVCGHPPLCHCCAFECVINVALAGIDLMWGDTAWICSLVHTVAQVPDMQIAHVPSPYLMPQSLKLTVILDMLK